MAAESAIVCHLGRVAYGPTWDLQERIKERLAAAKRRRKILPHVILLLEHPPVYTLGKSGDAKHLLLAEDALVAYGAQFIRTDRGGDITFHGPGQLVGYFLLDLDRFFRDLHRYMRALEEIVIRTCADSALSAHRVPGRTGVWTGPRERDRKICAFGIRSSRWVTMHGLALNLNTDLSFYDHIVPCGIADRGVTSLARELGRPFDEAEVRQSVVRHFEAVFDAATTVLEGEDAFGYLEYLTDTEHLRNALEAPVLKAS